jgi:hypothetical protein
VSLVARTCSVHEEIVFSGYYMPVLFTLELNDLSTAMILAENTQTAEQSDTMPNIETGRINNAESFPAAYAVTLHSEQPAPVFEVEREDLTTFFAVGVIINFVMITAYFIWAFKQWGKTGASDE